MHIMGKPLTILDHCCKSSNKTQYRRWTSLLSKYSSKKTINRWAYRVIWPSFILAMVHSCFSPYHTGYNVNRYIANARSSTTYRNTQVLYCSQEGAPEITKCIYTCSVMSGPRLMSGDSSQIIHIHPGPLRASSLVSTNQCLCAKNNIIGVQ